MKYMVRYFTLIIIFSVTIITCMQFAKDGISKVTSTDYYHVDDVVKISKEDGKAGPVLFGKDYTKEGLAIRENHLERLGAFNYFTVIGKGLSHFVTYVTEKGVKIVEKIPSIIDSFN
ncbi:hypothetical protein ACFVR2_01050 [Gottfriedia sp. NPDC057991]|uniref:hypothetical protein n=1 Tax=Gottfriedia sp. NPDC057991 TaxID=3346298 RepID=UPI0036DD385D